MKRFAFLVLVFSVAVIAEDKDSMEYQYELIMNCIHKANMTKEEVEFVQNYLIKKQDDDIDYKTEEFLKKYGYFAACLEEDLEMMKDSYLVLDKIIEYLVTNNTMDKHSINKDFVKECVNALNDDSEMTREERATGAVRCILTVATHKDQEK
ncbi:uncharacterized protein LOC116853063 [Odontomachus brunneus]|uniref:uncharacterized protein LOC116853063 n=1 Tax=Odontomachus brunneus TaxID=486640 RepID=UPI0013F1D089|nr:uncharacterized protein LOC116853063 [Odontomachus brunneus]